jgi:hypothetical protein
MTIYTYYFSRTLSNTLGISHIDTPEISDQNINIKPTDCCSVPAPVSEETRRAISQSRMGQPAPNKGIPNPKQSLRWKTNNPMFNDDARERMRQSKIGKRPSNYVDAYRTFSCDTCGKVNTVRNVKGGKTRRFCDRSCQATFTNTNRRGFKSYSSQPPAAEHANS